MNFRNKNDTSFLHRFNHKKAKPYEQMFNNKFNTSDERRNS